MSDSLDTTSPEEHSERGPSTAHRWTKCPASVRLSRGLPNTAGIEAARGTVFHEIAALCVEFGLDPAGFIGFEMEVEPHGMIEFDADMAHYMQPGLDLIESYRSDDCLMIVEKKVSLSEWVGEGEFGTTDLTIIDFANWRIICFDWKYGAGVPVSPIRNKQAMLYTLGAWSEVARDAFHQRVLEQAPHLEDAPWDDVEVVIVIEQPRAPGGGGVWKTDMHYLLAEGARIRAAADLTLEPDAPVVPGEDQCKFCKAAQYNTCTARAQHLLGMMGLALDEIETAPVEEPLVLERALSPEARSRLLRHAAQIKSYLDDLHKEAYHDAETGRPVPGLKLVEGRSLPRSWTDPTKAESILVKRLGEDAYAPRSILSPAQIEKVVGKKGFATSYARHVTKPDGKPILVSDEDPREARRSSTDYLPDSDDVENLV